MLSRILSEHYSPLCSLLVEAISQIVIVCQQKKKHLMILLWMSIMIITCEDKTLVHIMIIKCSVMKNLLDLCRGVDNLLPRLLVVGEGERHPHPLCSTVCSTLCIVHSTQYTVHTLVHFSLRLVFWHCSLGHHSII